MRVGIVTITELENFGNRLQNYALQETLKSLGAHPETIPNYINYKHRKTKKWQLKQLLKGLKNRSRSCVAEIVKIKRFEKFDRKYFTFSKYYSEINSIPENLGEAYDYFVAGSDQIWNPVFPFNLDFNFLTFCSAEKRISYAGSFGVDTIPPKHEEKITAYLNGFSELSVREFSGREIVRQLSGKDASVVLDPSMLLDRNRWLEMSKKPRWIKEYEKYILVYYLGQKEALEQILKTAKEQNPQLESCKIIDIHDKTLIRKYSITPDEFVWLIDHSELMITDSFHGTVFSILMQTPFVHSLRVGGTNMNSRISSLFQLLELTFSHGIYTAHLNNAQLLNTLEKHRAKSVSYLKQQLHHGK